MLIAAAAVYGGVSYTALKREQLNELNALCHMLRLMQDELETRALPLPELAAQLEERTENAGKALLSGLLRRLPELGSRDFQNIWEECVTESVRYSGEAARALDVRSVHSSADTTSTANQRRYEAAGRRWKSCIPLPRRLCRRHAGSGWGSLSRRAR